LLFAVVVLKHGYMAQEGLEHVILLPQPPEIWHGAIMPTFDFFFICFNNVNDTTQFLVILPLNREII
jgi:hypothetical protein